MLPRTLRAAPNATLAFRRHATRNRSTPPPYHAATTNTHNTHNTSSYASVHSYPHRTLVTRASRRPPQTYAVHARAAHYTTLPPDYGTLTPRVLELWDTEDLDKLEKDLAQEREKLFKIYEHAKLEKRRVVWRNAEFDLKRIGNVEATIRAVRNNPHREW